MKLEEYMKNAIKALEYKDVPTARLDVLVLLEDALGKDRSWLLAHPELPLDEPTTEMLNALLKRRAMHEPLAYIRGHSEFYGRDFLVTPATLQPRPETETMIDMLKNLLKHKYISAEDGPPQIRKDVIVVDVGAGSGCIGITAKLEWPELKVLATEINKDALKVAMKNADNLGADIKFYRGNILEPVTEHVNVVLANLPYVPDGYPINEAAMQEPSIAIFGGKDGLDLYREMFVQLQTRHDKIKYILTESLPFQHSKLAKIALNAGFTHIETEDFIQVFEHR